LKDLPGSERFFGQRLMAKTDSDTQRTPPGLPARLKDWKDQASWEQFDQLYRPLIFRFALSQGLTESEAEDVAQETLLAVAKAIRRFQYSRARCRFKHWLLTLARHRIADHFRRQPNGVVACALPPADPGTRTGTAQRVPDPSAQAAEALWEAEWAECVTRLALERLKARVKPKHFQVFYLFVVKGQPAAQVARALGVNRALVYLVKHRLKPQFDRAVARAAGELDTPGLSLGAAG